MAYIVATPRSLDQNLNNPTSTVGNFRIKGFVNHNFVKPTIPRTIPNQGILTSADDPQLDLSPQRSNPQHSAPLSPPNHSQLPMEMNGYGNQGPAFDKPNGYNGHAPTMNGHSHMMNGHGNGRNYSEDYESNQNIPIRNAHEKTAEQIRRETQQFIDRKEEERKFKEESQNRLREKQEDQRRTREMLEDHEPFGRPGAGAPNGSDNKKKKFIEEQFNARGEPARYQYEPNPDMAREQDHGLDGMPPFHSPGRNSMGTDRQRYDQVKENLQQMRRENEMLERSSPNSLNPDAYLKQKAGFGPTYGNFYKRGGISSPKSAPDTNIRFDDNPYDNLGKAGPPRKPNREIFPAYDPFGKSGAGAPRKDMSGNRVTQIQGLMDRSMQSYLARQEEERMNDKKMQIKYRGELDLQVAQNTRKGNEQDRHKHESQRDYADIIDSYRARPRSKHHLPHSDISRARDGRVPVDHREAREYHEELDIGFSNNLAKKRLDRLKDSQESRRHFDKMSTYWGRYGGGNRKSEQYTHKGNLENLINNEEKGITPRYDSNEDLSPRYTRVTVDSHHANQYDYPMAGPSLSKKYYEMKSPWAPH